MSEEAQIAEALAVVRDTMMHNVVPFEPGERQAVDDPLFGEAYRGIEPGQWLPDHETGLPPHCPVQPVGVDGSAAYFVDVSGQVQAFEAPYGKGHLLGLFGGRMGYLAWAWPRWGKGRRDPDTGEMIKGKVDGYDAVTAAADLLKAAHAKGVWTSFDKIRGRGCWEASNGKLVLHLGDKLIVDGRAVKPGYFDGHVYPLMEALRRVVSIKPMAENPAEYLLPILQTWAWKRPDVDPMLLLGWIGSAHLAGALPWRPTVFMTGDKGTGKSTLQAVIKAVMLSWLVQSADTTAAGIYQHIGQDSLAVAVDELEGEEDNRKQKAALKLARLAASGAVMLRGGDRHEGVQFQARSSFLFSSINTPPLEPQDLSRMAILMLERLPAGQEQPRLDATKLARCGEAIVAQMISQWPRFYETWQAFRRELAAGGLDSRSQDTFGTLLACADMMAHDGWDEERLSTPHDGDMRPWCEVLAAARVSELEDANENWAGCLRHLLSVTPECWRNTNIVSVGRILEECMSNTGEYDISTAKRHLAKVGLGLVKVGHTSEPNHLAIPNQHPLTRTLFAGSKWAGSMGAGVWAGALKQASEKLCKRGQAKINGVNERCTLVSLEALLSDGGLMAATDVATEGATE
jgi:hypothetical protein